MFRVRSFLHLFETHARRELRELYAFTLLYSFAFSLVTIFEPVFFYQEGFSLSFIGVYYGLHYSLYAIIMPLGGKFAARFGLERSLAVSVPIFVLYFLTLSAIPDMRGLVWLAVVLLSVHKIFYWPAFHADFAKFSDKANTGTEISWMRTLRFGVGILGPIVGGFIAALFGFPVLFIFTALLVFLSVIPLLRTKEQFKTRQFDYREPWRLLASRKHRNLRLAMIGMGDNLIAMMFWPIFLFIVLGSTQVLGIVTSASVAVMAVLGFFVGEMSDRAPRQRILRLHAPFAMIGNLLRPFAAVPTQAFLTDALNRAAFIGINIPLVHKLYNEGKRAGVLRYMVSFELMLAIVKAATAFTVALIFALALPYTGFVLTFVLAAVLVPFYAFL